jgi:hypothetical protein
MARWTSRLTSVRFEDSAALGMLIGPGPGSLTVGDMNDANVEKIRVMNRGQHDGFILGDDLVQDCSLSIELTNVDLTNGAAGRVLDFIRKAGTFASAASMDSTVWAWKTIVTMTDGATTTTITLPACIGSASFGEGKEANTLSISFTNHGTPVIA